MDDDLGGFFAAARPVGEDQTPGVPGRAPASPTPSRSPVPGILAVLLVAGGLAVTVLGGNQGGLLGMPLLLIGVLLGAIAWGRDLGRRWGQAAVLGALGFVGLAVLAEFARL